MKKILEDDNYCFVCGEKNPYGLHLTFSAHDGKVLAEFIPQKNYRGYKDIVDGGIISALIDEAMVKAALMQGKPAITAEIMVSFNNPLLASDKAIIEATIIKMNKKIIETSAIIRKTDNTLIAEGYGKLLRQD